MPRRRAIPPAPVRRTGPDRFAVELDPQVRRLIAQMADELRQLLSTDSPALARLFPPPYGDDEERNQGYAVLAGAELVERRLAALDVVEGTVDAQELDGEQLEAWMRSINDVRLVLGTLLEVDEDDERGRRRDDEPAYGAYELMGWLLDTIVEALADDLDASG